MSMKSHTIELLVKMYLSLKWLDLKLYTSVLICQVKQTYDR